jgi:hypothetical protein
VSTVNQFKSHGGRTFLTVFDTAGRAKTAFAAERRKFHVPTMRAGIHGSAVRRVTAVDHLGDIFHYNISWMKGIFNYFIIVFKNFL